MNARSKSEKHSGMTDSLSLLIILFKSYRVVKNRQSNHLYAFEMYMLVNSTNKVHLPLSDFMLHSNLQKRPMDNRESSIQKKEMVLVNKHLNTSFPHFLSNTCKSKSHYLTIVSCIASCIIAPVVFFWLCGVCVNYYFQIWRCIYSLYLS